VVNFSISELGGASLGFCMGLDELEGSIGRDLGIGTRCSVRKRVTAYQSDCSNKHYEFSAR
jgi:hypothetical protein